MQSGKGKVAFLSPALHGMVYHSTHVSEPWPPNCEGSYEAQRLLPFSQGLSRAAPAPWPGLARRPGRAGGRQCLGALLRGAQALVAERCLQAGGGAMGPAGLRELSLSDLTRKSASLEIALQRRAGVGVASSPPVDPVGSGLERLQVLELQCVKATVTAGGLGWEPELPAAEPVNACPGCVGSQASAEPLLHTASHRCVLGRPAPGSVSVYLSEV